VLGLSLDSALRQAVQAQAGEVSRAAAERVATEMVLTLAAGRAGDAARLWHGLGLLEVVVPDLSRPEPDRPQGLDRVFADLDRLEALLVDLPGRFQQAALELARRIAQPVDGAVQRSVSLRLAGLLRGLNPAEAGSTGRRLRLSGALLSLLKTSATLSRYPGGLPAVGETGVPGPGRAAVLFLWAAAPWEPETIILSAAASCALAPAGGAAAVPATPGDDPAGRLMAVWAERARGSGPLLPFDGIELMKELGVPAGPRLGNALRAARLAWEAGEAVTAGQALVAAREALAEQ